MAGVGKIDLCGRGKGMERKGKERKEEERRGKERKREKFVYSTQIYIKTINDESKVIIYI